MIIMSCTTAISCGYAEMEDVRQFERREKKLPERKSKVKESDREGVIKRKKEREK